MNLQQLIDEKIALGNRLIEDNPGLTNVWLEVNDVEPIEIEEMATKVKRELTVNSTSRLQLLYLNSSVTIWLHSKPLKINTQISYELI